jgi:micrococcal nuclease
MKEIPAALMGSRNLVDCTYANTPVFNFKDKEFEAKCVKVYDGDTVTMAFMVFGEYYKFNIRMYGYDSPELKSELDAAKALEAREFLAATILDKTVLLKCGKYDKYGRVLGIVYLNGVDINSTMISNGHGKPYYGGKKE